jgi:hypothetical protein
LGILLAGLEGCQNHFTHVVGIMNTPGKLHQLVDDFIHLTVLPGKTKLERLEWF